MDTLKPYSNGPSYSNTVIGTLAVDGWAGLLVTFGTARRGLGWLRPQFPTVHRRCLLCAKVHCSLCSSLFNA